MATADPFLDMPLNLHTQDLYGVRTRIRRSLRANLPRFHGTFLDIGCGVQPYRPLITAEPSRVTQYLGMDLEQNAVQGYHKVTPELVWDGRTIPLPDASVDCGMATEVLEHCPDPGAVLREAHRVLRPNGVLFISVPFLWPLHDVPYDEYRYTPFALERIARTAGFAQVELRPMGGWDASLAQMLGLWVIRRPMPAWKRGLLKRLTLPVVRQLLKHDHVPDPRSGPMITGIAGIIVK